MKPPNDCPKCLNSGIVFDCNQSAVECSCEWGQMPEDDYYLAREDYERQNGREVGERASSVGYGELGY